MVYNCTTGSTNPFHWGEVGMILPVFLNVRITLNLKCSLSFYVRIIREILRPLNYQFILTLIAILLSTNIALWSLIMFLQF